MSKSRTVYPFTAIVAQEQMKKALALNAINFSIGGVLIRGHKGTAKSTAARGLAHLLPEIEVVENCPFNCHPTDVKLMCPSCRDRRSGGEDLPVVSRNIRVVDLPLGSSEDRVVGTLDIEHAIKTGEKIFEPGVLAEAHRSILYVDEVNLLDDHIVDVLLDAAAMGVNIVEREGISYSHPARFILVGTMNPEEGELRPQLLDRFGLCVNVEGVNDPKARVEIVQRCLEFEKDPARFAARYETQQAALRSAIAKAQETLPEVTGDETMLELAASIAIEMGVHGHRADIAMMKVAHTIAAYHGRTVVMEEDVREAAELVLPHRMRRRPFEKPQVEKEKLDQIARKKKSALM